MSAATRTHELEIRDGTVVPAAAGNGGVRIVALQQPSGEELDALGERFAIPEAVRCRTHERHTRARADREGDVRFLSLRPARYDDAAEQVRFGELQIVFGPRFVLLLEHDELFGVGDFLAGLDGRLEQIELGPASVLHAALDAVVEGYDPVIAGLENDIDEIEDEVFTDGRDPLRRIYQLLREVISFQRATDPLDDLLEELVATEGLGDAERRFLRDAHDRAKHARERAAAFRALLENVLNVNLALQTKVLSEISIDQNEQMKKISSWAAILFTPTLVGGIYGMNFEHMPELSWKLGYPMSLAMMLVLGLGLYWAFRRRDWL